MKGWLKSLTMCRVQKVSHLKWYFSSWTVINWVKALQSVSVSLSSLASVIDRIRLINYWFSCSPKLFQVCKVLSSGVVLVIDITWDPTLYDVIGSLRANNVPYIHIDISIKPFARAFFKFIDYINSYDVAMILQNEKGIPHWREFSPKQTKNKFDPPHLPPLSLNARKITPETFFVENSKF